MKKVKILLYCSKSHQLRHTDSFIIYPMYSVVGWAKYTVKLTSCTEHLPVKALFVFPSCWSILKNHGSWMRPNILLSGKKQIRIWSENKFKMHIFWVIFTSYITQFMFNRLAIALLLHIFPAKSNDLPYQVISFPLPVDRSLCPLLPASLSKLISARARPTLHL